MIGKVINTVTNRVAQEQQCRGRNMQKCKPSYATSEVSSIQQHSCTMTILSTFLLGSPGQIHTVNFLCSLRQGSDFIKGQNFACKNGNIFSSFSTMSVKKDKNEGSLSQLLSPWTLPSFFKLASGTRISDDTCSILSIFFRRYVLWLNL